jgi:hypothetical protein
MACIALSGCSYAYDLVVVLRDGFVQITDTRPAFEKMLFGERCVRTVRVNARTGPIPPTAPGDDMSAVIRRRTYWAESIGYEDHCSNRFPLTYGVSLRGEPMTDDVLGRVSPKAILTDVVYDVSTTTGAGGYGMGRFVIWSDGRLENLPH